VNRNLILGCRVALEFVAFVCMPVLLIVSTVAATSSWTEGNLLEEVN